MMTEADEDRVLVKFNQFYKIIGGICLKLGIPDDRQLNLFEASK